MRELDFQFCVFDPEGDYVEFEGAAVVGDRKHPPSVDEVMSLLQQPAVSVIVNLLAVDPSDRPAFLIKLLPELTQLRSAKGRPHWIVIDEAHHCLPADLGSAAFTLPQELPAAIAVTVHPRIGASDFLELVSVVIGVGDGSRNDIAKFCEAMGRTCPMRPSRDLEEGQIHVLSKDGCFEVVDASQPESKMKRHARKYAEGELGEDKSFYFRGPKFALNLRAHNLMIFLQMAAGVDDETWLHHLRAGDYSKWFRDSIKDDDLADQAREIEEEMSLDADATRAAIKKIVEQRYTAPAKG